jgi:tRNA G46 methylase TrmB
MADQQAGSPNTREVEYWNSAQTRAWADEHEAIDRLFAGLTQIALDHAAPKLGERVIDIGCGSGTTVLELASRVGPTGYVVGADVSKPSVEKARERVAVAGIHQAEIMLCDVRRPNQSCSRGRREWKRFRGHVLRGPAYDLRQDTQGHEIRRSTCLSSFPHAARE